MVSAPLAASQKVVFDPSQHLSYWPSGAFDNMKSGLIGGHLRIANVGAFSGSAGGGRGFELVALADASFHTTGGKERQQQDTHKANHVLYPPVFLQKKAIEPIESVAGEVVGNS